MKTVRVLAAIVVVVVPLAVSPGTAESSGAGPDCSGWLTDAFWQAAAAEDAERCLAAGAKVDAKDWEHWSPLHYAAAWGKTDLVNTLIAAGAKVDARINSGATPLHWAAVPRYLAATSLRGAVPPHKPPDTVNALIAAGAKVDARDRYGKTPLHWVVESGKPDTVNSLDRRRCGGRRAKR